MTYFTWTIDDAEVQIGNDARFWNCSLEVEGQREIPGPVSVSTEEYSGTIEFTHPVPKSLFLNKDNTPIPLNVVAENDTKTIEIESILCADDPSEGHSVEFVALDGDMTVEEADEKKTEVETEEPTVEENAVSLLTSLLSDIALGKIDIKRIDASREACQQPYYENRTPCVGPKKLEITYDNDC